MFEILQLPNETSTKLPVWVWIYPGRRLFGDTHPYHYGPEYIMDKPVVFVCANYRMNVVGMNLRFLLYFIKIKPGS